MRAIQQLQKDFKLLFMIKMTKLLIRLRKNFIELVWIKSLIVEKIITSSMGRIIEGAIFTVYAGIIAFMIQWVNSGDWTQWKATLYILWAGFAKTILEAILVAIRNRNK